MPNYERRGFTAYRGSTAATPCRADNAIRKWVRSYEREDEAA